jgi:hypothetical protein
MAIKTFTDLTTLPASDINTYLANSGLVYVAETSFTTAANPFINGCFSSNYQNYLVQVVATASGAADLYFRMRSGTNTPESGSVYDRYGFSWGTSGTNLVSANLVAAVISDVSSFATANAVGSVTLYNPNLAVHTITNSHSWGMSSGSVFFPTHRIETTTQYTGIELTTLSAVTLTGTMRVYGYRQA